MDFVLTAVTLRSIKMNKITKKYKALIKTSKEFKIFVREFSKGFDVKGNYPYILSKFEEYKMSEKGD